MRFDFAARSEVGPRSDNEDCASAWQLDDGTLCLAVADGLGGRGSGGVASAIAVRCLRELVREFPKVSDDLTRVFRKVHEEIKRQQDSAEAQRFMATTLTAVFLGRSSLIGAHTGDTRAVIARGKGIKKLTSDHSEAQRLLVEGKITKEEFLNYPRKHILESALGSEDDPQIDIFEFDLQAGDRVFVSSDGFHTKLPLRPMLSVCQRHSTAEGFSREAVEAVHNNNPNDNYSIAVAYVLSSNA